MVIWKEVLLSKSTELSHYRSPNIFRVDVITWHKMAAEWYHKISRKSFLPICNFDNPENGWKKSVRNYHKQERTWSGNKKSGAQNVCVNSESGLVFCYKKC